MPTPPSFISSTDTVHNNATTPKTTASIAVTNGDLLIAWMSAEASSSVTITPSTASGSTSAWTEFQAPPVASTNQAYLRGYWATATATGNITVSFTEITTAWWFGGTVKVYRGHAGIGLNATANNGTGSGTPSVAVTCSANSALDFYSGDWSATTGARTYTATSGTPVEDVAQQVTNYSTYSSHVVDVGASGSKSMGMSAPGAQRYVCGSVEILGVASASDPFRKLDWFPALNIPGSTLQSVNRNPLLYPNPIPFAQNDWTPVKPFFKVGPPQAFVRDPSKFPNPIPFNKLDWPSSDLLSPMRRHQPQPYNLPLYTVVVASAPFSQNSWPIANPLNPRVSQLPVNVPILNLLSTPFAQYDWQVGKFTRPDAPDGLQQTNINLFTNPIPFSQLDWSKTVFRAPKAPEPQPYNVTIFGSIAPFAQYDWSKTQEQTPRAPDQQAYNFAIYNTVAPVAPPFRQLDWSKTTFQTPRAPDASTSTSINLLPDVSQYMMLDWSGSGYAIKGRAPDPQAYNQSLYTTVVVTAPFYQTDWTTTKFVRPDAPDGLQQTNINLFTNPIPFSKTDWSKTSYLTPRAPDASVQINLSLYPPPTPGTVGKRRPTLFIVNVGRLMN